MIVLDKLVVRQKPQKEQALLMLTGKGREDRGRGRDTHRSTRGDRIKTKQMT